jgi:hypothetical protein
MASVVTAKVKDVRFYCSDECIKYMNIVMGTVQGWSIKREIVEWNWSESWSENVINGNQGDDDGIKA